MEEAKPQYYITNGKLYITKNTDTTSSFRKAGIWEHEKAQKVYESISRSNKFYLQDFKIVEYDEKEHPVSVILEDEILPVEEIKSKLSSIAQNTSALKRYNSFLSDQLSIVELAIVDIQHYIEFAHVDACKGFKAYKLLQDKLRLRRQIKDSQAMLETIKEVKLLDYKEGSVQSTYCALKSRNYSARVLTELFED